MENAMQNGAKLLINSPVVAAGLEGGRKVLETPDHRIEAKVVINAAGLFADDLAQMFGDDYFAIKPRKGEEYLFDMETKDLVTRTIFPVPSKVSKGILVIPTSEGNLMIGPTGDNIDEKENLNTSREGFQRILDGASSLVTGINPARSLLSLPVCALQVTGEISLWNFRLMYQDLFTSRGWRALASQQHLPSRSMP